MSAGVIDAAEALRRGDIVLLLTDTVPGLHILATVPEAGTRLRVAKGSAQDRPFLLLVADVDAALALGRPAAPPDEAHLRRAWPGPLTALLRPTSATPRAWTHRGLSVAVRVPALAPLRALLARLSEPLFSTSANRAGQPPAADLEAARRIFPGLTSYVLGADTGGDLSTASTLVDFTVTPARVLRPGPAVWPPAARMDAPGDAGELDSRGSA